MSSRSLVLSSNADDVGVSEIFSRFGFGVDSKLGGVSKFGIFSELEISSELGLCSGFKTISEFPKEEVEALRDRAVPLSELPFSTFSELGFRDVDEGFLDKEVEEVEEEEEEGLLSLRTGELERTIGRAFGSSLGFPDIDVL